MPVGLAVAGQLSPHGDKVLLAPNLKWSKVSLARDVAKKLGVRVQVENDVRAAARGELRFGALRGANTGLCVFWGSGIGGAIVAHGQVVRGARALAGEIGHLTYKAGGKLCACGKRGCYEAYCGGHVLDRAAHRMNKAWHRAADLSAGARSDVRAAAVMETAKQVAGQLVGCLVTALDPDRVVIGGGLG